MLMQHSPGYTRDGSVAKLWSRLTTLCDDTCQRMEEIWMPWKILIQADLDPMRMKRYQATLARRSDVSVSRPSRINVQQILLCFLVDRQDDYR